MLYDEEADGVLAEEEEWPDMLRWSCWCGWEYGRDRAMFANGQEEDDALVFGIVQRKLEQQRRDGRFL